MAATMRWLAVAVLLFIALGLPSRPAVVVGDGAASASSLRRHSSVFASAAQVPILPLAADEADEEDDVGDVPDADGADEEDELAAERDAGLAEGGARFAEQRADPAATQQQAAQAPATQQQATTQQAATQQQAAQAPATQQQAAQAPATQQQAAQAPATQQQAAQAPATQQQASADEHKNDVVRSVEEDAKSGEHGSHSDAPKEGIVTAEDGCWKWGNRKSRTSDQDAREGVFSWLGPDGRQLFVFGGCADRTHPNGCANHLEVLNLDTHMWDRRPIKVDSEALIKAKGAAYAYNADSKRLLGFGGTREGESGPRITNVLDVVFQDGATGEWTWRQAHVHGKVPPPLQDATLTVHGNTAVLMLGYNSEGFHNAVHFVTTSAEGTASDDGWAWASPQLDDTHDVPAARGGHSATRVNDQIVVFGGTNSKKFFDDVHVLTIPSGNPATEKWSWKLLSPANTKAAPSPRAYHGAALVQGNKIVIYGGANELTNTFFSDVFILDLTSNTWLDVPASLSASAAAGQQHVVAGVAGLHRKRFSFTPVAERTKIVAVGGCNHHSSCYDIFAPSVLDLDAVCKDSCGEHGHYRAGNETTEAECVCVDGYQGKFCAQKSECKNSCSGRGHCKAGTCECDLGFGGADCGTRVCPGNCTSPAHGSCSSDLKRCVCAPGHWGLDCSQSNCPNDCSGRGICQMAPAAAAEAGSDDSKSKNKTSGNYCKCTEGFSGPGCEIWGGAAVNVKEQKSGDAASGSHASGDGEVTRSNATYDQGFSCLNNCRGHGICKKHVEVNGAVAGVCECIPGFAGADCSGECALHCTDHQHGTCVGHDPSTVKCACEAGYRGSGCFEKYCQSACNSNGICHKGECFCSDRWKGGACELDTRCSDHGKFVGNGCQCDPHFGGRDCSVPVTCEKDCAGHGKCMAHEDEKGAVKGRCVCDDAFRGETCEEKACPKDCSGNGVCRADGRCSCFSSFAGDDCGLVLECPGNCTASHGTCLVDLENPESKHGKCACEDGWGGEDCASLACPQQCNHRGKCVNGLCLCDSGYSGKTCETACPSQCTGPDHGVCQDGVCKCFPGFSGEACQLQNQCPGNCTGHGVCFAALGKCSCSPGYSGLDCSVAKHCGAEGCLNDGVCHLGKCQCAVGYEGDHCERMQVCEDDCNKRGICHQGECLCSPGFAGDLCEQAVEDKSCPKNCSGNGKCRMSTCFCVEGYTGDDCSKPVASEKCMAEKDRGVLGAKPCSGMGFCRFDQCWCAPGAGGEHCHRPEVCPEGCVENQGLCINQKCRCYPGFKGPDCSEDDTCPAADGKPCSGQGVCMRGRCACHPGYAGVACEVDVSHGAHSAGASCPGNCTDGGVCHMGRCFCVDGRDGPDCSIKLADSCPESCNRRGLCRFGQCFCKPGHAGPACEHEVKCSERCLENGVCAYGACFCVAGWEGPNCDIPVDWREKQRELEQDIRAALKTARELDPKSPECPEDCRMHGVCINGTCACEAGYYGADCGSVVKGPLASRCVNDCSGTGTCLFGKCFCNPGWGGNHCQVELPLSCVDDCNSRGKCFQGSCYCNPGFEGDYCQHESACDPDCNPQGGLCVNGRCLCVDGYAGDACYDAGAAKSTGANQPQSAATSGKKNADQKPASASAASATSSSSSGDKKTQDAATTATTTTATTDGKKTAAAQEARFRGDDVAAANDEGENGEKSVTTLSENAVSENGENGVAVSSQAASSDDEDTDAAAATASSSSSSSASSAVADEDASRLLRLSSDCLLNCGPNGICVQDSCYCSQGYTGPLCQVSDEMHDDLEGVHIGADLSAREGLPGSSAAAGGYLGGRGGYFAISVVSFVCGVAVCLVMQVLWEKQKRVRRQRAAKDILKPLLNSMGQVTVRQ